MTLEAEDSVDVVPDGPRTAKPMYRWLRHTLSPARIGVVYVLIVLIAALKCVPDKVISQTTSWARLSIIFPL